MRDEQWQALAGQLRRDDLAALTTDERLARQGELDEIVAAWTAGQDGGGLQFAPLAKT